MNTRPLSSQFARRETSQDLAFGWVKRGFARIAGWMAICADYHAAAGLYDELSRLSDAELRRRGLSRDTLARDICESTDRGDKM